ncbi:hypothetical protein AB8J26_001564 [Clostridium perfringens]|uniref:Uncharacterized protein n=3 Tax=Clostridium perfringens TaxID=1502 RepID=A0AAN5N4R2_CLOPF|nr:hypothetical protein [Clostridium perfringens]ABG83759.1 conserved domain protein [Clostridium perfringens ATCC 13124]STB11354.1 Uncharacterised protein [Clostridium novyi]DAL50785.1 MAG TPA_asm: hypothetical protein [Caudoviricetes sp.]AQW26210.1 hypothetical protein BXT94_05285 [Clostridium perfringens]EIF2086652.1 hypothetical protein [Clostridium perfringens]
MENKITAQVNKEQLKVKSIIQTVLNCLLIITVLVNIVSLFKRENINKQLQMQIEENKLAIQKVDLIVDQLEKEITNLQKKGSLD